MFMKINENEINHFDGYTYVSKQERGRYLSSGLSNHLQGQVKAGIIARKGMLVLLAISCR
jgi:hypothetical protein